MQAGCQHHPGMTDRYPDAVYSEEAIPVGASWADTWLGRVMDAQSGPLPVPRSQVEEMSQQLRGELRSALRHAYLGPKCAAVRCACRCVAEMPQPGHAVPRCSKRYWLSRLLCFAHACAWT